MLHLPARYQHVINVYLNVATDLVFDNLIDKMLVRGSHILQAKKHYFVVVEPLSVMKEVSSSLEAIRIWLNPEKVSMKLSSSCLDVESTN